MTDFRISTVHHGQVARFLARPRWQKNDLNDVLRAALLRRETGRGMFLFLIDATLFSQSGKKTENAISTGNRNRRPRKRRRYSNKKNRRKNVHSFTFGLLITPSRCRVRIKSHITQKRSVRSRVSNTRQRPKQGPR